MTKGNISQYVEGRLEHWAAWYRYANDCGIGYPRYSAEYKIMKGQGVVIKGNGLKYLPSNEAAEEIEALVVELSRYSSNHKKIADALRQNYFGTGTAIDKAHALHVSYPHFKVLVDRAKQWLEGRLSSKM